MTEQEKKELLDELEKRMDEKYKGCLTREDVATTLKRREKSGSGMRTEMEDILLWQMLLIPPLFRGRFGKQSEN